MKLTHTTVPNDYIFAQASSDIETFQFNHLRMMPYAHVEHSSWCTPVIKQDRATNALELVELVHNIESSQ
jgi:hypothetical protein